MYLGNAPVRKEKGGGEGREREPILDVNELGFLTNGGLHQLSSQFVILKKKKKKKKKKLLSRRRAKKKKQE